MGEPLLPQESGKGQDWGEIQETEACRVCFTRGYMRNSVYLQYYYLAQWSDEEQLPSGWEGTWGTMEMPEDLEMLSALVHNTATPCSCHSLFHRQNGVLVLQWGSLQHLLPLQLHL